MSSGDGKQHVDKYTWTFSTQSALFYDTHSHYNDCPAQRKVTADIDTVSEISIIDELCQCSGTLSEWKWMIQNAKQTSTHSESSEELLQWTEESLGREE